MSNIPYAINTSFCVLCESEHKQSFQRHVLTSIKVESETAAASV